MRYDLQTLVPEAGDKKNNTCSDGVSPGKMVCHPVYVQIMQPVQCLVFLVVQPIVGKPVSESFALPQYHLVCQCI